MEEEREIYGEWRTEKKTARRRRRRRGGDGAPFDIRNTNSCLRKLVPASPSRVMRGALVLCAWSDAKDRRGLSFAADERERGRMRGLRLERRAANAARVPTGACTETPPSSSCTSSPRLLNNRNHFQHILGSLLISSTSPFEALRPLSDSPLFFLSARLTSRLIKELPPSLWLIPSPCIAPQRQKAPI